MQLTTKRNGMSNLSQPYWTWLLRNMILPFGDLIYSQGMMSRLRFLENAQWWDAEQLHGYRNRLLTSLLQVAYREVPFYRSLMDASQVKPEDIRNPGDLRRLPLVTKNMLRAGYPHLTTRSTGLKTYEESSSGSTGKNFYVQEDFATAGWYRASFMLALEWAGWRLGEPHLQTGMTLDRRMGRWIKDILLRCSYMSAFDLSDSSLDEGLALLESNQIQHLWGYPGSLYWLARRALCKGWNRPLRSIITWGDCLYPHYRQTIETAFKARVTDTYGCAEGIQISAQCGESNTYHVHTLDVIVECLDDEGLPVPAGQPGNLILTRLYPGPMPLIRYQVGDVGIMGGERKCECGRGYDVMESIQGRDTDIIITPSGNRLIVHFFTGIVEHFPEIESFQVVQEESDAIVLRVVPSPGFSQETATRVVSSLRDKGAADLKITVEVVTEIALPSSGKRRFIMSKISQPTIGEQTSRFSVNS